MRTLSFCSICVWFVVLQHAPSALAQADGARDRPEPQADELWYGWQTLATDGVALTGFLAVGLLREADGPAYGLAGLMGFGGYLLGAPLVHAVHENWGTAVGSLALRLLPLATGAAMFTSCGSLFQRDKGCEGTWGAITLLTFAVPIALDPAVFAYEDAPKRHDPQLRVAAWLDRSRGGLTFGDAF